MAKENKLYEYLKEKGFSPKEGKSIVVKYEAKDLGNKIESFFLPKFFILTLCENEIVIVPVKGDFVSKIENEIELSIAYSDIDSIEIEEVLLNYSLVINTKEDTLKFTAQQGGLNDLRGSSMHTAKNWFGTKNWHKENIDGTLKELEKIGK